VARDYEVAPDALALAGVLDQSWADVVLSGAATPEQLRSNLAALDIALDDPLRARVRHLAEPAASCDQPLVIPGPQRVQDAAARTALAKLSRRRSQTVPRNQFRHAGEVELEPVALADCLGSHRVGWP